MDSASPVDLSCPRANGVQYVDFSGASYNVLCNVTFPFSVNVTGSAGISARGEMMQMQMQMIEAEEEAEVKLDARDVNAAAYTVPLTISCSNQCSNMTNCIAATAEKGQCVFISDLGTVAEGSSIADTVIMAGKRIVAPDGSTSTSLAATARPTLVSSRSASGYVYPTATTTTTRTPASSSTSTYSDCGLLGLNCGPSSQSSLTTQRCVLGLNVLGGLLCEGPTPSAGTGSPILASPTTVTTPTTSYSKITVVLPVTTVYTTSTVSYCSVGPNNFTSCSSVPKPTLSSTTISTPTVAPVATSTKNCGLLGLNCAL